MHARKQMLEYISGPNFPHGDSMGRDISGMLEEELQLMHDQMELYVRPLDARFPRIDEATDALIKESWYGQDDRIRFTVRHKFTSFFVESTIAAFEANQWIAHSFSAEGSVLPLTVQCSDGVYTIGVRDDELPRDELLKLYASVEHIFGGDDSDPFTKRAWWINYHNSRLEQQIMPLYKIATGRFDEVFYDMVVLPESRMATGSEMDEWFMMLQKMGSEPLSRGAITWEKRAGFGIDYPFLVHNVPEGKEIRIPVPGVSNGAIIGWTLCRIVDFLGERQVFYGHPKRDVYMYGLLSSNLFQT